VYPCYSSTQNLNLDVPTVVWATVMLGDMNCDGSVDFSDINLFVLYITDYGTWQTIMAGVIR
jgi:hypothetical protein